MARARPAFRRSSRASMLARARTVADIALRRRLLMSVRPLVALLTALLPAVAVASPVDFARGARVFIEQQALPPGGEVEVVVGEPDSRLTLAPCVRYEPFIPTGAKLWGRSSLGVRCVEGANWTIFVPIEVRVWGAVQVAARPIARGRPVTAEDVRIDRVDLTRI